jgi:hypothetical protein
MASPRSERDFGQVQEIFGAGETVRNGQKRSEWGTDRTKTAPQDPEVISPWLPA